MQRANNEVVEMNNASNRLASHVSVSSLGLMPGAPSGIKDPLHALWFGAEQGFAFVAPLHLQFFAA